MKKFLSLAFLLFISFYYAQTQETKPSNRFPEDFIHFFNGKWEGEGQFANGKVIKSSIRFNPVLDGSWLSVEHSDISPYNYKAISMWGINEQTGEFIGYTFDNFHGHRKFATEGWVGNKIIFTINEYNPKTGQLFQHFVYEKLSPESFKLIYETSKDCIAWKLVDFLVFRKTEP